MILVSIFNPFLHFILSLSDLFIEVKYTVFFKSKQKEKAVKVFARSDMSHLVAQICKALPGKVSQENLLVQHGSSGVLAADHTKLVYPLIKDGIPFHISEFIVEVG